MASPASEGVNVVVTVRIESREQHSERAISAGASILSPPTLHEFVERRYVAEDFDGHRWIFGETVRDAGPKEWGAELLKPTGR